MFNCDVTRVAAKPQPFSLSLSLRFFHSSSSSSSAAAAAAVHIELVINAPKTQPNFHIQSPSISIDENNSNCPKIDRK